MDAVIYLLTTTASEKNKYGVYEQTKEAREVFCQVDSVTRAEFFGGGRNGLNPQYKFTMFSGDYEGEDTVIYNGLPYGVYRTFNPEMDRVELYCERKGGTNGLTQDKAPGL